MGARARVYLRDGGLKTARIVLKARSQWETFPRPDLAREWVEGYRAALRDLGLLTFVEVTE